MTGQRWGLCWDVERKQVRKRMTQSIGLAKMVGLCFRAALAPAGGRYGRVWEYDGRGKKKLNKEKKTDMGVRK